MNSVLEFSFPNFVTSSRLRFLSWRRSEVCWSRRWQRCCTRSDAFCRMIAFEAHSSFSKSGMTTQRYLKLALRLFLLFLSSYCDIFSGHHHCEVPFQIDCLLQWRVLPRPKAFYAPQKLPLPHTVHNIAYYELQAATSFNHQYARLPLGCFQSSSRRCSIYELNSTGRLIWSWGQ